jgi:hypothetical protein
MELSIFNTDNINTDSGRIQQPFDFTLTTFDVVDEPPDNNFETNFQIILPVFNESYPNADLSTLKELYEPIIGIVENMNQQTNNWEVSDPSESILELLNLGPGNLPNGWDLEIIEFSSLEINESIVYKTTITYKDPDEEIKPFTRVAYLIDIENDNSLDAILEDCNDIEKENGRINEVVLLENNHEIILGDSDFVDRVYIYDGNGTVNSINISSLVEGDISLLQTILIDDVNGIDNISSFSYSHQSGCSSLLWFLNPDYYTQNYFTVDDKFRTINTTTGMNYIEEVEKIAMVECGPPDNSMCQSPNTLQIQGLEDSDKYWENIWKKLIRK